MDACDLLLDFWDKVIFYDYYISHSGMIEIEPHITMWTSDGEQYCLKTNELRDRRFERVIPFFEPMANKEKIAKGDSFYFDWELVPNGWKHYYHQSNHCFMPDAVYDEFMRNMNRVENAEKGKTGGRQARIEDELKYLSIWESLLKQSYKEVLGTTICEDVVTYIRLDEKIHVYNEPYVGKHLTIDRISDDVIADLKNAAAWSIHYTAMYEGLWKLIRIVVYFEQSEPFYMEYEFQRKDLSNYIDEQEFMEKFMALMQCDFGSKENGYSFENAPKGFTAFQRDEYSDVFWIRDDLYQMNYHNVFEPFIHYKGNERFLTSPICGCFENKEE